MMIGTVRIVHVLVDDRQVDHNGYLVIESSQDGLQFYFKYQEMNQMIKVAVKQSEICKVLKSSGSNYKTLGIKTIHNGQTISFNLIIMNENKFSKLLMKILKPNKRRILDEASLERRLFQRQVDMANPTLATIKYCKFKIENISIIQRDIYTRSKLWKVNLAAHQEGFFEAYVNFQSKYGLERDNCKKMIQEHANFTQLFMSLANLHKEDIMEICYSYWVFKSCHSCASGRDSSWKCEGCKAVYYCDVKCQTKDWPLHQQVCESLKEGYDLIYSKPQRVQSYLEDIHQKPVAGFRSFRKYCLHKLAKENNSWKFMKETTSETINHFLIILYGAPKRYLLESTTVFKSSK